MRSEPMTTEVKICGLKTEAALEAALAGGADYVGFVFFAPSPRNVTPQAAKALTAKARGRAKVVALMVDPDDALIDAVVASAAPDFIQLHGQETPERTAQLKAQFGLPVWKALSVASAEDVARAHTFAGAADLILFDAKTPKGAALPGGMGLSFDWSLVANWKSPIAWGLAGGLTPDNVAEAVRLTGAPLVDTSSGVEGAPGVKDMGKIAAFCTAALSARP
jgi:phosphoribosylanthranilate isomerase